MNIAQKRWAAAAVLAAVFAFMLLLNRLLPLRSDDYLYSMVWGTSVHIDSWETLFQSLENHYMTHGGRMVTVFFLDLFLWAGKLPFDIANALVYTGVLMLLSCHILRRANLFTAPGTVAMAALCMWLCLPHFGEVAVWKSGATVYLWSGLFVLLFLLPYNLHLARPLSWGPAMALPMFAAGILGGWSVENLAVTTVILAAGATWHERKRGGAPLWMYTGTAGAVLGFIALVAAPGNFVRYEAQGAGKGILRHIGNQIAGNGEMILYVLPLILLAILAWHVLQLAWLGRRGEAVKPAPGPFTFLQGVPLALIAILTASYFSGGILSGELRHVLIAHVLLPLGKISPQTVYQVGNLTSGFEEMAVWWAGLFFLYFQVRRSLGFTGDLEKRLRHAVSARALWDAFPQVRYAGFLGACALVNNFFLMGGPTFPARAAFGSTLMLIAAAVVLLRIPEVQQAFAGPPARLLRWGGGALAAFIAIAAVSISWTIAKEHAWRLDAIIARAGTQAVVELPPIEIKGRALRHVFYKEFQLEREHDFIMNHHYGMNQYYQIKGIRLKQP